MSEAAHPGKTATPFIAKCGEENEQLGLLRQILSRVPGRLA
jgi:hypothetical protein